MVRLPFTSKAVEPQVALGFNIRVGPHSNGQPRILWNEAERAKYCLEIGDYCSIAEGVIIYVGSQGRHPVDFVSTYPLGMTFPTKIGPTKRSRVVDRNLNVSVGSDVWLGRECLILAGVTIGHGAVIGARALVTKDVPPYAVVGGVPARQIGSRFSADIVVELLDLAWWNLDPDIIARNVDQFMVQDIVAFLRHMHSLKYEAQT
jgi:chloramphenicol O-acetyltransferase type B